ncbi:MAG: sigma-54-dependent Fis family transcriptional regulator, partial [Acidobacteria bacterium]
MARRLQIEWQEDEQPLYEPYKQEKDAQNRTRFHAPWLLRTGRPMVEVAPLVGVHYRETGEFERVGSSRTRRVDVRVISATNADLRQEVAAGRFRQDLLFRLNTVEIHLPPLRERLGDIPLLAEHFLHQYARRYRKPVKGFHPAAVEALLRHSWPGNVRELDHVVQRAVLLARGQRIGVADLGLQPDSETRARLGVTVLPRPGTAAHRALVAEALEEQHYRLVHWRAVPDLLDWRRFF